MDTQIWCNSLWETYIKTSQKWKNIRRFSSCDVRILSRAGIVLNDDSRPSSLNAGTVLWYRPAVHYCESVDVAMQLVLILGLTRNRQQRYYAWPCVVWHWNFVTKVLVSVLKIRESGKIKCIFARVNLKMNYNLTEMNGWWEVVTC